MQHYCHRFLLTIISIPQKNHHEHRLHTFSFVFFHSPEQLQRNMLPSSIEGYLTRQHDIRFIDAREIANEAKISLGISGYPTKEECVLVRLQASRIFARRPESEKAAMQRMNSDLVAAKSFHSVHSASSIAESLDDSESSSPIDPKRSTKRGWLQRTFSSDH